MFFYSYSYKYYDVSYTQLNVENLETQLDDKIKEAISKDQYFHIGVAKANGTTIQSLCYRQGNRNTQPYATGCSNSSAHRADVRARKRVCATLTKVFYPNRLGLKPAICDIEKRLIERYKRDRPTPCLNRKAGDVNCISTEEGIVYLRIYSTTNETDVHTIGPTKQTRRTIGLCTVCRIGTRRPMKQTSRPIRRRRKTGYLLKRHVGLYTEEPGHH